MYSKLCFKKVQDSVLIMISDMLLWTLYMLHQLILENILSELRII